MSGAVSSAVARHQNLSIGQSDGRHDLLDAVKSELIPRLLKSHVPDSVQQLNALRSPPSGGCWSAPESVAAFAMWCVNHDNPAITNHLSSLLSRRVSLDSIYLHLLQPAARYLGDQWLADALSFVDVQMGLTRLHRLLHECEGIAFSFEADALSHPANNEGQSIWLSSTPGDQHTFGVAMVSDFFRRQGWQVSTGNGLSTDEVVACLQQDWHTVCGFSLHNDGQYDVLAAQIERVRKVSCNPDIMVIVGGDYFVRNPNDVERIGADLTATDAHRTLLETVTTLHIHAPV